MALGADFTYHGALIESHFRSLQALGRLSPYLDPLGGPERFSLRPAVYGGTTYGLIASLRFLLPLGAVMAVVFAMAFGAIAWGVYTASRAAQLPQIPSLATATIAVSSGAVLSTLYGRTAVAELIAWASLTAGVGAYAAVRSAASPGWAHQVVLFLAAVMFFGGHPLTLVFASTLVVLVLAIAVVAGARPARVDLRPASILVLGACVTLWQWPLTIYHLSLTQVPSADVPVQTTGFVAPLGPASAPNIIEVFDPTRRGAEATAVAGIHNEVPGLAFALLVILSAAQLWNGTRIRRLVLPIALILLTISIVALPHSLRLVRLVPMLGAMQYHWRLYPYAVATIVAGVILVLRTLPARALARVGVALAVIAVIGFTFGQMQVWRNVPGVRPATLSDAAEVSMLDPNPIYRNDARSERDPRLPVLDHVDVIGVPIEMPRHAEDVLAVRAPSSGLVAVPSALAPPFVELRPGDRAVGWYAVDRQEITCYESGQLWLVVDHRSDQPDVEVRPSADPIVLLAKYGSVVALLAVPTIAVVLMCSSWRRCRPRGGGVDTVGRSGRKLRAR